MVSLNRLYRNHCDLYILLKFKISFLPLRHSNNEISKFRIEGFEGNLILVRMIVKSVPRAYSGGLHVLLKYIFWLILAREREELESWFFGLAYLFDLYLLGSQYQMSTQTDMYWPLTLIYFASLKGQYMSVRVDLWYCDPSKYRSYKYAGPKNQLSSSSRSRARINQNIYFERTCRPQL